MQFLQSPALPQVLGCGIPSSRAWFDIKSSPTTEATPHRFEPCVPDRAVSQLTHPPGSNEKLPRQRSLQKYIREHLLHAHVGFSAVFSPKRGSSELSSSPSSSRSFALHARQQGFGDGGQPKSATRGSPRGRTKSLLPERTGKKIIFLTRILGWKGFSWPSTEDLVIVVLLSHGGPCKHLRSHPWSIFTEEASPNSVPNQTCIRLHISIPGKDSNLASTPRGCPYQKARGAAGVSPFFATNPLVPLTPINKAALFDERIIERPRDPGLVSLLPTGSAVSTNSNK
nr:uncharacterized protein LOC101796699 isoform X1 [Anas platyrhynchos]XP_038033825.1 uncharacterized protein LOC101796699 isoform X1 [Anas platyrhynchos]XP_038033828.1 uncharacterized protein LOC101796699 isoform X1 [Anas platyrhynchos]